MALTSVNDVWMLSSNDVQTVREKSRREISVTVNEAEVSPSSHRESHVKRGTLASVLGEANENKFVRYDCLKLVFTVVGAAV
jgi:hypothetical protein